MTVNDWETSAAEVENGLLPFQTEFLAALSRKDDPPEIAALSVPRGNGKSWLCGGLVARALTPGDALFEPGVENILVSSSTNQARITLEFREGGDWANRTDFRWSNRRRDPHSRVGRAVGGLSSSDSRRALGLGANVRLDDLLTNRARGSPTSGAAAMGRDC